MKTNVLEMVGSFHQGGSERQAIQLAGCLRDAGDFNVFLATLDASGSLRSEVETIGFGEVPEFRLTSFYDWNMLRQLKNAAAFIRRNDIKIVHTHDFYTNVFGMFAAKLAGVRVRIASKRETGGMKTAKQLNLERAAFRPAHLITANSRAVKDYLIEEQNVAAEKIAVVYNGLDLRRLEPQANLSRAEICRMLGLTPENNRKFVTIVANLRHEIKNHRMFLRSAQAVRARVPNAEFVLAGEGELLGELKDFAETLNIGAACHFTGRCAAVAELLSISDACVLSSTNEGFSNSILEYMAAGKPVVATNVGGAGEAIVEGANGFLVASDDADAMAARLVELLENPEKARKLGAAGRKTVEEKFSAEAQIARTVEIYEKLLSGRRVGEKNVRAVGEAR